MKNSLQNYCTHIDVLPGIRVDLFTPTMFRVRRSSLKNEPFPTEYEIPFAVGHTESWEPVAHTVRNERNYAVIRTEAMEITCWEEKWRLYVKDLQGNRLYPSTEATYGLFQNHCTVFDSATVLSEPTECNRYSHWFYNHETKRYDIFLEEDALYDVYFLWGKDYPAAFKQYNTLVGPEPMPARKTFGYHQTQHLGVPGNQKLLMQSAKALREKNIPCDTLIVDYEWGDGSDDGKYIPWGYKLDWSETYKTPLSPKEMLKALADMHYQVMLIHHSIPGYAHRCNEDWVQKEFNEAEWWAAMDSLIEDGVAGTWQDTRMTDITNARVYDGLQERLGADRRCLFMGNYDMYDHNSCADISMPTPVCQRIGGRRYPYSWTGDMDYKNWNELEFQIQAITNRQGAMKGITYLTNDCMRGAKREISVRSSQFQCFNAITRSHTGKPWQDEKSLQNLYQIMDIANANSVGKAAPVLAEEEQAMIGLDNPDLLQEAYIRQFLTLRYRLIPYIYTYAHENYETGMPICRPMLLAFPDDANCNRDQWPRQYLFGEAFLVAPVCSDMPEMEIYLPADEVWVDYWTKEHYKGGQTVQVETTDLSKMPLFVRAGSIIPMRKECCWIDHDEVLDTLYLDIYPGESCRFTLYEDDGISLAYQQGAFATTEITCSETADGMMLHMSATKGEYNGKPKSRTVIATVYFSEADSRTLQREINCAEESYIYIGRN